LIEVGSRLQEVVRSDTVARLGGDEFVVLAEVESDEEAFEIAERIARSGSSPSRSPRARSSARPRWGSPWGARRAPAKMLREADAAMYRAKAGAADVRRCSTR
jgi:diguanylate cyclase (GGDEF)-like protein